MEQQQQTRLSPRYPGATITIHAFSEASDIPKKLIISALEQVGLQPVSKTPAGHDLYALRHFLQLRFDRETLLREKRQIGTSQQTTQPGQRKAL